jgi:YesN/AraC family two-component response regulator
MLVPIVLVSLALSILTVVITPILNLHFDVSPLQLDILKMTTVIFSLAIVLFLVWHHQELYDMLHPKEEEAPVQEIQSESPKQQPKAVDNKLNELFAQIEEYFEKEQPYCLPDFNIGQLAHQLNSNVSYISAAIRSGAGCNFNNYINDYRIKKVVSMLDNNILSTYTISSVFAEAGFKYQSTFNAAFSKSMNMTPSEYIASKKNEK